MEYSKKVLHSLRRVNPRAAYRISNVGANAFSPAGPDYLSERGVIDLAIGALSTKMKLSEDYLTALLSHCRKEHIPLVGLLSRLDVSMPTDELKRQLAMSPSPDRMNISSIIDALDFSQQLAMKKSKNAHMLLNHYNQLAEAILTIDKAEQQQIMNDPGVSAFRVGQSTIVTASDDAYEKYGPEALARSGQVSEDAPVMVTSNAFSQGKLTIEYQKGQWVGFDNKQGTPVEPHLSVDALSLTYRDPKNGSNLDLLGVDRILNDPDYFEAFLATVAKHTDRSYKENQPQHLRVKYHDMRTIAALHGVQRNMEAPITATVYPCLALNDKTLVVASINGGPRETRRLRGIVDAPDVTSLSIYFGSSEEEAIAFNPANLSLLKRGHREFSVRPSPSGGYEASGAQPLVKASLDLPSQTRQQKALVDRFIHQPKNYRRYITQTFDESKVKRDSGPISSFNEFLPPDAEQLLSEHKAKGFASLDIIKDPIYQDKPVYVAINIYTPNKDGWYTRRAQQIITSGVNPSQIALESLGMSQMDFDCLSEMPMDADRLLSKVFSGSDNYIVMMPGAPTDLDTWDTFLPSLATHLKRSPQINMQTYQKQQGLSVSGRDEVTFYPGVNKESPARFSADAILSVVKGEDNSRVLSTCGKFIAVNKDQIITLQDIVRQSVTELGDVNDIAKQIWKKRAPTSFHGTPGSDKRLLTYSIARNTLNQTAPRINDYWAKTPYTDALKLSKSEQGVAFDAAMQKAFNAIMDNGRYDFSLSPRQNAASLLSASDLSWDTVLMGGVGGKAGQYFLNDLKKADARFFDHVMSGRGVDEHQLLKSKQAPKSLKEISTITFGDVATYYCEQYEASFPEQKSHYKALEWLPALLEQCPPTFKQHPKERFDALFSGHGVDVASATSIYETLYEAQKATPNAFGFLYQDNMPVMLSTSSIQRDRAFLSQAMSTPSLSGESNTLTQHITNNHIRQALKSLTLLPPSLNKIEHNAFSDMRKILVTTSTTSLSQNALSELSKGIKLLSSIPSLSTSLDSTTQEKPEVDNMLTHRVNEVASHIDHILASVPEARIVASENGVREFMESVFKSAKDDSLNVPFNSAIPGDILDFADQQTQKQLGALGFSDSEISRYHSAISRAKSQYIGHQAIQRLRIESERCPVLSDDRLSRMKDVSGWMHKLGYKTSPLTFKEVLVSLANSDNGLPKATNKALLNHAENDKAPSKQSLAYQIEQHAKRLLRQSLPPLSSSKALKTMVAEANMTSNDPMMVLAELSLVKPLPPKNQEAEIKHSGSVLKR